MILGIGKPRWNDHASHLIERNGQAMSIDQAKQKTLKKTGGFQSGLGTKSPTLTSKEAETQAGLRPAFVI